MGAIERQPYEDESRARVEAYAKQQEEAATSQGKKKKKKQQKKRERDRDMAFGLQQEGQDVSSSRPPPRAYTYAKGGGGGGGGPPVAAQPIRPLLVLLDLNGVLVHRGAADKRSPFSVRPGALTLLASLHGQVNLAFCTSMNVSNAVRAIKTLKEAAETTLGAAAAAQMLYEAPIFAGDDYHFRNDVGVPVLPLRVPSLAPYRKLRNLAQVWESAECVALGHNAQSTILVDDTPGKAPLSPGNVLLIRTWDGAEEDPDDNWAERLSDHLLAACRAHVASGDGADVRTWLESEPSPFLEAAMQGAVESSEEEMSD